MSDPHLNLPATKWVVVRLTDGAAFYTAGGGAGGGVVTQGARDATVQAWKVNLRDLADTISLGEASANPLFTDPIDRAARLLGALDVASRIGKLEGTGTNPGATNFLANRLTDGANFYTALPYQLLSGWTVYSFGIFDVAGVAAAQRFVSLFRPAAVARDGVLLEASVTAYSIAAAITRNSMRLTRITAASAGTLQAAAAINKWDTTFANAALEVRTANPTVTAAAEIAAFVNKSMTVAGATAVSRQTFAPGQFGLGEFLFRSNEGVAFMQTIAGDTDETFDFQIVWAEHT